LCNEHDHDAFRGGSTVEGALAPRFTCCPSPDSKARRKNNLKYRQVVFFRFRRTDKMDSVMRGLRASEGPMLSQNF